MANILIVDDDAHIIRVMSIWLVRQGHQVSTARNGREALEVLRAGSVDLLISDMNMPVMDGIELARTVRVELGAGIPIVMLTARCDQDHLNQNLAGHAVGVFPKPFLPSQLVAEIERLLGPVAQEGVK